MGAMKPSTLRELRLSAGLSQAKLAEAIGTSQPRVARLEAGREEPGLSTLRKLAAVLGTDFNSIEKAFA
jgi:transcriptional regulator with XRE-family HTH domain